MKRIPAEDVYRDLARVPEHHRLDSANRTIAEGSIRKLRVGKLSSLVIVRGVAAINSHQCDSPCIHLDEATRNRLGLVLEEEFDLELEPVGMFGSLVWAWKATEVGYRVAARLGVLSVVLGVLGVLLGVLSLWSATPKSPRPRVTSEAIRPVEDVAQYTVATLNRAVGKMDGDPFRGRTELVGDWWFMWVKAPTMCDMELVFTGIGAAGKFLGDSAWVRVPLSLKNAEIDGTAPSGNFANLRMKDTKVSVNFKRYGKESLESEMLMPVVPVPAYDEVEARRLGRALNEQIQLCGGWSDPYAKRSNLP
ncbi:MAG: hypothetical protein ABI811_11755 [Acidobacteriota bacterium]